MAAFIGGILGIVMITGALPAAFIAYARSQDKDWAHLVGFFLAGLLTLANLMTLTLTGFIGCALSWGLILLVPVFVEPKQKPGQS